MCEGQFSTQLINRQRRRRPVASFFRSVRLLLFKQAISRRGLQVRRRSIRMQQVPVQRLFGLGRSGPNLKPGTVCVCGMHGLRKGMNKLSRAAAYKFTAARFASSRCLYSVY